MTHESHQKGYPCLLRSSTALLKSRISLITNLEGFGSHLQFSQLTLDMEKDDGKDEERHSIQRMARTLEDPNKIPQRK